ncbi:MAG: DUF5615 family PIN-like protein, partial [Phycisphaeraceae bacterium]|nr:DUF5615 family PIN-like protein [Phycisphaeraceae bacterium]
MTRFKLDENLPVEAARTLQEAGFDAVTVIDQGMQSSPDHVLIDVCRDESRCLVTLDLDFANIRAYPPEEYGGIIVLRLGRQDRLHILNAI